MGFKIFHSDLEPCKDYSPYIERALETVQTDKICGLVMHGVDTSRDYHSFLNDMKSSVYKILGKKVPVTLVPQFKLPEGGISLDVYTLDEEVHIGELDDVCYGVMDGDGYSVLFVEGIPSSDFSFSVSDQSDEVFGRLDSVLAQHGLTAGDIVRQWNYIGEITGFRGNRQNYQEFNDARSRYYGKVSWENGYPAATGIGTDSDGIIVSVIACKNESGGIFSINNPLQIAAHAYSKNVLVDDNQGAVKSTPKFERAKLFATDAGAFCFVSGTAAIRGEESVNADSAGEQTLRTIENINYLVSKENRAAYGCEAFDLKFSNLVVYVKKVEDYQQVRNVVEDAYPGIPAVYTVADVCRSELLVEIEGLLIS